MSKFQLAQLNIAKMKYLLNSPEMSDFVGNLDRINALAEDAPGFIWRSQSDDGNAVVVKLFGSNMLVNMSVWSDIELLHNYVYRSEHSKVMSKRKEWFERIEYAYSVLWWVPENTKPTFVEAKEKLFVLKNSGPTNEAFTFKNAFPAPNAHFNQSVGDIDDQRQ